MTATKGYCKMIFFLKIRYNITNKTWAFGQYASLRTGWSDLRAIYLPQSDQPVRKLAYCPQAHVLFVKYT